MSKRSKKQNKPNYFSREIVEEIKRDLRSPMVQRGLIIIANLFLIIIYHVLCWNTFCG